MATSAYQSSKRVSVFLSMTDEVETMPIVHVSLLHENIITSRDLLGCPKHKQVRWHMYNSELYADCVCGLVHLLCYSIDECKASPDVT